MEAFRDLKKSARQNLRGNWLRAVAIQLLLYTPGLLSGLTEQGVRMAAKQPAFLSGSFAPANAAIPSMVAAGGCALLCFLLWAPLLMGSIRWHWRLQQDQREKTGALFHFFESYPSYLKATGMAAQIGIRIFLWYSLFCLPGWAMAVAAFWFRFRSGLPLELGPVDLLLPLLLTLWALLAAGLTWITAQRYFLAPRLLAERPTEPVRRLLRKSVRLMRGYQARVLLLQLSFWPWYLPGVAAAGCFVGALVPTPAREALFWAAAGLLAVQWGFYFYMKPLRNSVMARYAGEILYGFSMEEPENVTREYFYKSGEMTMPPLSEPDSGEPFVRRGPLAPGGG